MSRTLIAVLLLLLVGGSGAAFSLYVLTSANDDGVTVSMATTTPTAPAAVQNDTDPTAAVTLVPQPTSTPDTEATVSATEMPADRPAALPPRPYPTIEPGKPTEVAVETPEWSVVEPERWAPTGISIPDIGVAARIVDVGLTDSGEMEAPVEYDTVGWYRYGAKPGEQGRTVLAGHVDSKAGPAIFYRLRDLAPGSVIEVTSGAEAQTLQYVVRELQRYPENDAPLERIFGPSDVNELILITCDGDFDFDAGVYHDRLIVFADLVPEGQ